MFTAGRDRLRKAVAAAAATGMVALGLVATGTAGTLSAFATPRPPVRQTSVSSAAIDMNKNYTISVEPQLNENGQGTDADGKEGKFDTAKKLPSGTFKLEKGKYDVSTVSGYNNATAATADTFTPDTDSTALTQELNGEGKATFTVKPGLYRLTQTVAPNGYLSAVPALILIPLTDKDTGKWMDKVTVYPKNGKAGKITKKDITDANTVIKPGSKMKFEISSPIPTLKKGDNEFTVYQITDKPSEALKVDSTNSKIEKVEILDGANKEEMGKDTYEVLNTGDYGIKFTATGLTKLKEKMGKSVVVTLSGTVAPENDAVWTKAASNWVIENKASYNWDSKKGENGGNTTEEEDHPKDQMAKVKIMNKDGSGTDLNSKNAEFDIYSCGKNSTDDKPVAAGDPLYTGVKAGTETGPIAAGKDLCIKQTKAPDGYELGGSVAKVKFTKEAVKKANEDQPNNPVVEVTYTNTLKSDSILSKLPLTGGAGIALFLIVAAGLFGGAYYYARRSRAQAEN